MRYNQPFGVSDPEAPYINGDPSVGRAGSIPPAASIEFPQREIVNIIRDAGLVLPNNNDLHQIARSVQSMLLNSDDDAGYSNQYQVTQTPAPAAYHKYMMVIAHIMHSNTGPSTLNVNAMGPRPILNVDRGNISAGELLKDSITCFEYDGDAFQIAWSTGRFITGMPIFLTAPRIIYVNWNTGDDTNFDGTTAVFQPGTQNGPFKTCGRASFEVNKWNLNNFDVTVHVADSPNYPAFNLPSPAGNGTVTWRGNPSNPFAVVITGVERSAIVGGNCGNQTINGFTVTSSGSGMQAMSGIEVWWGSSQISAMNINYGFCGGAALRAVWGANISISGAHYISGNFPGVPAVIGSFFSVQTNANIQAYSGNPPSLTVRTSVYIASFAVVGMGATLNAYFAPMINTHLVTGQRYQVQLNGIINSQGGGISFFPGTIAGYAITGGQFV